MPFQASLGDAVTLADTRVARTGDVNGGGAQDVKTCFMCEAYCPVDALYVAPEAKQPVPVDEEQLAATGLLGSYRAAVGWGTRRKPGGAADQTFRVLEVARGA